MVKIICYVEMLIKTTLILLFEVVQQRALFCVKPQHTVVMHNALQGRVFAKAAFARILSMAGAWKPCLFNNNMQMALQIRPLIPILSAGFAIQMMTRYEMDSAKENIAGSFRFNTKKLELLQVIGNLRF
jgi:hypothetical protein